MAKVKKGFKVVHLNIRSLSKHLDEVYLNLAGFDIIALTETWLHVNIPDSMVNLKVPETRPNLLDTYLMIQNE